VRFTTLKTEKTDFQREGDRGSSMSAVSDIIDVSEKTVALIIGREPSLHSALQLIEPFRAANRVSGSSLFDIDFIAADPDQRPTSMGIDVPLTTTFDVVRKYDLVLLLVSYTINEQAKPKLFKWLRRQSAAGAHLCGIDAGPLLLAEAGLLNGYRATCHWTGMAPLKELLPESDIVEQLYVIDRSRSTCAGQSASMDYSMAMLRKMTWDTVYNAVCNELIYASPRAPELRQRELTNAHSWLTNPILSKAQSIMKETVEYPLEIEKVAERCGISTRELQYLFQRHLNSTPKKIYMAFRLQYAKELLLYSAMSIRETGLASGFTSPSAYYRAFHSVFQKSPQEYRRDFARTQSKMFGRNLY
jgi:AraC family carnitine catabolism transcriptional activator